MPKKTITPQTINQIEQFLKDNGAPAVVLRSDVGKYSCRFLHPPTVRNHDSLGTGPLQRVVYGQKRQAVGYPIRALAEYLHRRGFVVETREAA